MSAGLPPEVLFHRFFQLEKHGSVRRAEYKGKLDLDRVEPSLRDLLLAIQRSMNNSLALEKRSVSGHVDHPPFHFDYIDSETPNAVAFQFGEFSFNGITGSLVRFLWDACNSLGALETAYVALGIRQRDVEALHATLFQIQLFFVAAHEYTHHVHGHVSAGDPFSAEIEDVADPGNMELQAQEIDADGYAVYHVLANLIDGGHRESAVRNLQCENGPASVQDELLFSAFVLAVGIFMYARQPIEIENVDVTRLTHPPQAARMNCLMHSAIGWCRQNRARLEVFMTAETFQMLMNIAAQAARGLNAGRDWVAQTAFLRSRAGEMYLQDLNDLVQRQLRSS